jgi:hypothetical protein
MGGFLGIGGSSAKTDRSTTLAGYGDLSNVFNYSLPAGQSAIAGGQATTASGVKGIDSASADLQGPLKYFQDLMSGDRTKMTQAVAPETNAVRAGADAQKRQQSAMGTARGGGTAVANNARDTDTMAKVDNLLFGARPAAAKETASIAGEEGQLATAKAGLGISGEALGAGLVSGASSAAGTLTSDSIGSRETSMAANAAVQSQWLSLAQTALGLIPKGGGDSSSSAPDPWGVA